MSITVNGTNGLTFNDASTQNTAATGFGFKNRIINGAMMIDQRNAGASVTPTATTYTLDRWQAYLTQSSKFSVQQNAGSVTPPAGFANYLGVTSLSAYSVTASDIFLLLQRIEGFNTADLGWGTSAAQTVTLSFQVRSSLTGTFGGCLQNGAGNRSYPFTYTVSSANTWTSVNVTIIGDTTGTWVGATNGIGIQVYFSLGSGSTYSGAAGSWSGNTYTSATGATSVVGTSGATFYITGVQLEKGSTATTFDFRPYGTELMLCQRYFTQIGAGVVGSNVSANNVSFGLQYPVVMRTAATITLNGNAVTVRYGGTDQTATSPTIQFGTTSSSGALIDVNGFSVTVSGGILAVVERNGVNFLNASAEL